MSWLKLACCVLASKTIGTVDSAVTLTGIPSLKTHYFGATESSSDDHLASLWIVILAHNEVCASPAADGAAAVMGEVSGHGLSGCPGDPGMVCPPTPPPATPPAKPMSAL